jgi:hypothetical protein
MNCLKLFKETIAVYTDNNTKEVNSLRGQNLTVVKTGDT